MGRTDGLTDRRTDKAATICSPEIFRGAVSEKCMKTEVNPFSVPWTRKKFPHTLNGVLENVLVCAHFSSKLAHGTYSLSFIMQLFRLFGIFQIFYI